MKVADELKRGGIVIQHLLTREPPAQAGRPLRGLAELQGFPGRKEVKRLLNDFDSGKPMPSWFPRR